MARVFVSLIAAALLVCSTSASAQRALSASDGWIQASAGGQEALAFGVISNPTMYDVYVTAAATEVAGKVQLRRAAARPDGQPQIVEHLSVPAYASATLESSGVHLVLSELTRPLKAGETITLTLTTDGGSEIALDAVVK